MVFSAELPIRKKYCQLRLKLFTHITDIYFTDFSPNQCRFCPSLLICPPTELITNTHVYDTASNMAIGRKTFSI